MGKIAIVDLEVSMHVGVSDEERAQPQRLLLTVDMNFDFTSAAISDRITKTIDYSVVAQHLLKFGEARSWKLIEKLVTDIADSILAEFQPEAVTVQAKKFVIPQAQYVCVGLTKSRAGLGIVKKAAWGIP